jgi:hypothetical protein
MIDYLETMTEVAKDELDIYIKKLLHITLQRFRQSQEEISYSLNDLYRMVCISKQTVMQYDQRQLLLEADDLRAEHPGCGLEKM